jgi:hypothetical protein
VGDAGEKQGGGGDGQALHAATFSPQPMNGKALSA